MTVFAPVFCLFHYVQCVESNVVRARCLETQRVQVAERALRNRHRAVARARRTNCQHHHRAEEATDQSDDKRGSRCRGSPRRRAAAQDRRRRRHFDRNPGKGRRLHFNAEGNCFVVRLWAKLFFR